MDVHLRQEDILLVTRHRIIHQVMVAAMAMVKREVLHHHHRVVLLAMEVMTCMQVIHLQAMVAVMAASRARARAAATPAMAAIPATAVMGAEGNGAEILTDATSGAMEEGEMIEMMIGLGEIMMEVKEVVGEKEERDLKAMVDISASKDVHLKESYIVFLRVFDGTKWYFDVKDKALLCPNTLLCQRYFPLFSVTSSPGEAAKLHLSRSWSASARASRIAFQGLANGCIGPGLQRFFCGGIFFETEPYTERFMILMAAILWGVFRPSVEWHEGFYQISMLKIADNSIHHRRMLIFCPSAASSLPKRGTILFMWPRHGCRLRETSTLQAPKHIPQKWHFEDDFPFPKVGYVSSLESICHPAKWWLKETHLSSTFLLGG